MSESTPLQLRLAGPADQTVLERLWLMFRHDLSGLDGQFPAPDGTFRSDRLRAALTNPGWAAYLLDSADRPVGFALVRGLSEPVRTLNSFFVVRAARRCGFGRQAVLELVGRHPGPWQVAFQDKNLPAVRFWRRVATEIAGDAWVEEHRPVPDRPDLAPDCWISFVAAGRAGTRR